MDSWMVDFPFFPVLKLMFPASPSFFGEIYFLIKHFNKAIDRIVSFDNFLVMAATLVGGAGTNVL
jgi:hypothetical protein